MKVYFDFNDWWIGYYRGPNHHYVCPLPSLVFRWKRAHKAGGKRTLRPGIPGLEWHGLRIRHIDMPPLYDTASSTYTLAVLDDGTFTLRHENQS